MLAGSDDAARMVVKVAENRQMPIEDRDRARLLEGVASSKRRAHRIGS